MKHDKCTHSKTAAQRALCRRTHAAIAASVKKHKPGVGEPQVTVYAAARNRLQMKGVGSDNAKEARTAVATNTTSSCDYCGGPRNADRYNHTTVACPAYGSHLLLQTRVELTNLLSNMIGSGKYEVTPKQVTSFRRMHHAKMVQFIIKLWKTQGE